MHNEQMLQMAASAAAATKDDTSDQPQPHAKTTSAQALEQQTQ